MRIAQLDLKAFGHFTNQRIAFDAAPDLHIIYGPNEAGKTTLTRALRAALFGIPERTTDQYLHAPQNLRIGIVLGSSTGEQLAVMRRKARKNSLIKYDPETCEELGEAVADEQFMVWLDSLTEGLYEAMFGLDHQRLVEGGKALSEGKGELGQSLFEAGAGLAAIAKLHKHLRDRADSLFKPRAPTTAIHKVIAQYNGARKEAKNAQMKPADWLGMQQRKEEAQAAYEEARARRESLHAQLSQLERLAAVLPEVATRRMVKERLAALGDVARLTDHAITLRVTAETQLRQAEALYQDALANLERLQKERDRVPPPLSTLLLEARAIESLYHALGAFRMARDETVSATSKMKQADAQIESLLLSIGERSWITAPRQALRSAIPSATLRARIQGLATTGAALRAELEAELQIEATIRRECAALDVEIAALGPPSAPASVVEALATFDAEGNPETKASDFAQRARALETELQREAAGLAKTAGLTDSTMAALVAMGTPLPAELHRFRAARADLAARETSLQDQIKEIEDDCAVVMGELAGLMQYGEVPSAEHLTNQRKERDRLWQPLRSKLLPENPAPPTTETLPTLAAYEAAVNSADLLADHRVAGAERVSQRADLIKRETQMRNGIVLRQSRLSTLENERNDLKQQWQTLVKKYGLPCALRVDEMMEWLSRRDIFLKQHQAYRDACDQATRAAAQVDTMRARLSVALQDAKLSPCGDTESLVQIMGRVRMVAQQTSEAATRNEVLAKEKKKAVVHLASRETRRQALQSQLADWSHAWHSVMTPIFLAKDALVEEARTRLREFDELENVLHHREQAYAGWVSAQAEVARITQEVTQLCATLQVGDDCTGKPVDACIESIYERLTEAKAFSQRRKTIEDRIEESGRIKTQAEQQVQRARQELARRMAEAGCTTLPALMEAERRSTEFQRLERELSDIETRLVNAFALPLESLLAQAEGQDLAQVQIALARVKEEREHCEATIEAHTVALNQAHTALAQADGSVEAAEAEQRATATKAQIFDLIGDYASAQIASALLSEVIEEYQQRYKGPLLACASERFATITHGRFVKVAADYHEGHAVLVGVRPNGSRVFVDHLSTGTRDQLFLALRLATIERYVTHQTPMPVVVDDIVIHFDDASASATFAVLAELSRKTQVLFFTHHEHLLDRARQAIGQPSFVTHRL